MADKFTGSLKIELYPNFCDSAVAFAGSNSLNSYLAINLPFLNNALSTLEMLVLKEHITWILRQSEIRPSEIFNMAETGEPPLLSRSTTMFSASSMTNIEFGFSIRIEIKSGFVIADAMAGGKK